MPLTPEQIAKILQKEASLPVALKRDNHTNYREGYFFVTLRIHDNAPILSTIIGNFDALDDSSDAPCCKYTELGKKVLEVWRSVSTYHPCVNLLGVEVMPDHLHALLWLKPGNKKLLGHLVGGLMGACTHAYWDILGIDWRNDYWAKEVKKRRNQQITAGLKGAAAPDRDRDHTHSFHGPALFSRGYNDVEALTEKEIAVKLQYLHDQARKYLIKRAMRDCFRVVRGSTARGWTLEALRQALLHDRYLAQHPQQLDATLSTLMLRIPLHPQNGKPTLAYTGNKTLMEASCKLSLICHRADAFRFAEQQAAVMKAAREGAVIVSAFISPKEREIMKQLLIEQLPIIEVVDNGFSDRYKPIGAAFYACGHSRLAQISPWIFEYHKKDVKLKREMCMVMNQLVRVITAVEDGWWKKA